MDDHVRQFIICLSVYAGICILMLLLGLVMQTVTRFSDARLEKLGTSDKAELLSKLRDDSDLLRFRVLAIQMLLGTTIPFLFLYSQTFVALDDLFASLNGGLHTDSAFCETVISSAVICLLLIGL